MTPRPIAPTGRHRHVFLTGGTGLIGSGVLAALLDAGHRVSALARTDHAAATLRAAGAEVVLGTLDDLGIIAHAARRAEAVVHTASPGDETAAEVDRAVVETVLEVLAGTGKAYLHTSGVWTYGSGVLDERTPVDPLPSTAWRLPIDARVRGAATEGIRSVVIAPGIVHGDGRGLARVLAGGPRTADGALRHPGVGNQRWTTVHTRDLGRLYELALTRAVPGCYYLGVSGHNPTVRELARAADRGSGGIGRAAGCTPAETRSLFGPLGAALCLDQRADGRKARRELGWRPTEPTLVAELKQGAYAPPSRAASA